MLERTEQTAALRPAFVMAYLNGIVSIKEHVSGADAAVDAAHGHIKAKGEEVAVVEVAHAVIEPSCKACKSRIKPTKYQIVL